MKKASMLALLEEMRKLNLSNQETVAGLRSELKPRTK